MAKNTQLSSATANAGCNAKTALANGGSVKIYDGAKPADADTAPTTQRVLATVNLGNPAFDPAVGGEATLKTVSPVTIAQTGSASWFRLFNSSGSALWDGTVGTADANMIVGSTEFQAGAQAVITSCKFRDYKDNPGR